MKLDEKVEINEKDWLADYYPVTAESMKGKPLKEILDHSIHKWEGLLCLSDYGLKMSNIEVVNQNDHQVLGFGSDTCSLCVQFQESSKGRDTCQGCPIFESRGKVFCHSHRNGEQYSPYAMFSIFGDYDPMIKALAKAKFWLEDTVITHNGEVFQAKRGDKVGEGFTQIQALEHLNG